MRVFEIITRRVIPVVFSAAAVLVSRSAGMAQLVAAPLHERGGSPQVLLVPYATEHVVAVNGGDEGPGTADRPWATINYAAQHAKAGDVIVVRGGRYVLPAQVRVAHSGRPGAWITFIGDPDEEPILDAQMVQRPPGAILNNGAFQIEDVSYIRVANLKVINSHDAGFTVRDASHAELINNATDGTFSSGIAVWDTSHAGEATHDIRVLGNTVTRATTWDFAGPEVARRGEPPHEAISIGGAVNFEVAYNHIYDSDKEGIDIKETSRHGKVHHNLVHDLPRQCIYVDAWFGKIEDIDIFSNVAHKCHGAGIVLSVENGKSVENIDVHHNLVFNNDGSGFYFSRWGVNGIRRDIRIDHNVFYRNGFGQPKEGQGYYWMTGGLYLYSTSVRNVAITDNIFSGNRGFQIGYSELFAHDSRSWQEAARSHAIEIAGNVIEGPNSIDDSIESGGDLPDRVKIYGVNGELAIFRDPLFNNPAHEDFSLRPRSPAAAGSGHAGAYAPGAPAQLWWQQDFPPQLIRLSPH